MASIDPNVDMTIPIIVVYNKRKGSLKVIPTSADKGTILKGLGKKATIKVGPLEDLLDYIDKKHFDNGIDPPELWTEIPEAIYEAHKHKVLLNVF